jgi:hypothetical protein
VRGRWYVVKTRDDWAAQVRDAMDRITAMNGGADPVTIRAAYDVDPAQFGRMIEGMLALGAEVSDELIDLAGLHDVGDII